MNRLVIVGASGQGKVVADIAYLNGYRDIVFVDDNQTINECYGYPVVGTSRKAPEGDVFIAIGDAQIRESLMAYYSNRFLPILIHPSAVVARGSEIGCGSVIMANAVITPDVEIGKGCIINTCASIDHDCVINDFCHVAVGAHVCGFVTIGRETWIGAGATVINNISITNDCFIGAGAVVTKSITKSGVYIGVPAKLKKDSSEIT